MQGTSKGYKNIDDFYSAVIRMVEESNNKNLKQYKEKINDGYIFVLNNGYEYKEVTLEDIDNDRIELNDESIIYIINKNKLNDFPLKMFNNDTLSWNDTEGNIMTYPCRCEKIFGQIKER